MNKPLTLDQKILILQYEQIIFKIVNFEYNLRVDGSFTDKWISEIINTDYRLVYDDYQHHKKSSKVKEKMKELVGRNIEWYIGDMLYQPFTKVMNRDITKELVEEISDDIWLIWVAYNSIKIF